MAIKDKQIDAYIEKAQPFAQPILKHIRKLVHKACPDVEESMKWSFPHFGYKGMMCGMASFQQHCAFGFWKGAIMKDPHKVMDKAREDAMGHFGRLTSLQEMPSDEIIIDYIKEAMQLNEEGVKVPKKKVIKNKDLEIPEYFMNALKKNKEAFNIFEKFSYSKKKEYVEWIVEAKQETTRNKRLATAIEWISDGKSKNWKYE